MNSIVRIPAPQELLLRTNIVGVLASIQDIRYAQAHPHLADVYEWRVDCVLYPGIEADLIRLGKPIILTVRDPNEGGKQPHWGIAQRKKLFFKYLHLASIVDVEAANAHALRSVIKSAIRRDKIVAISCHYLISMPASTVNFDWALVKCFQFGGKIFKLAAYAKDDSQMLDLMEYVTPYLGPGEVKFAPMSIGEEFGPLSRLLALIFEAVLVYGAMHGAVIPGQLSVAELHRLRSTIAR